ncbi:LysR family transcriptional regulator [Patulibacter sp. SYSU D01012]|uniref:LysR family transcriptional regulator n=1 Tax=Patulibacter sp. SYSU D01012 TaxID=2817381 RepID=UPI001B317407|nr:LysR family transcriptional regulator [Patulibacter sp. SYSU D01012]
MELRHLEVFVAVAQERSFSRAADRLHLAQSAVSATVRALEADLGVELVRRASRPVGLTDAGAEMLPRALATLAAAQGLRDAADELRGGLRGTVRLGIMQVQQGAGFRLARLLTAFRGEHPDVRVLPRQRGSASAAADVRDGRLDLAIVGLPEEQLAGLTAVPLMREDLVVALPADHPLAARSSVALAELADEPFADVPPGWARVVMDRAFAAAGVQRRVEYELGDIGTIIDVVRHGLAVALVPRSFGGAAPATGGVALVPLRGPSLQFVTSIVAPADRPLSASARALRDTALRQAGRGPAAGGDREGPPRA